MVRWSFKSIDIAFIIILVVVFFESIHVSTHNLALVGVLDLLVSESCFLSEYTNIWVVRAYAVASWIMYNAIGLSIACNGPNTEMSTLDKERIGRDQN